jgi:hypothetical protein
VSLDKSSLNRNEKIILYSENIVHSAQAWMILKIKKFKSVYVLKGGMHEWKENILFPSLPENADEKQNNDFRKKEEVSRYFGGSPRTGDNTGINKDTPKIDLPKMQTSPGTTPVTAPKKKKEGC